MKPTAFLIQMPLGPTEPNMAIAQLYPYLVQKGVAAFVQDVSIALYHRQKGQGRGVWSEETNTIWSDEKLSAAILEPHRDWIASEFIRPIEAAERPVAGFSVTACSFHASLQMARWIKAARPDARVVFGGQIFTTTPETVETILGHPEVDAVVSGDGEETLAELAFRAHEGRSFDECPGAYTRGERGRPRTAGLRPYADLDTLPFADYSPFDLDLYGSLHSTSHDLWLMTNRGCVRRCSFCGHRTAWKGFRQMSGERVHAEILHQRKVMPSLRHADSEIKFYDLLINGDMRKLARLCELLRGDQSRLPWKEANAVIRPEMTEELCRSMYEAGCRELIIGLESGSQHVLDLMDKGQTIAQMKTVLKNIDRGGLKTRGNFMFGHPGETEEDFQATLDFLREMHPYIHTVYPSYTLTHLDGRLIRDSQEWGLAPGQDPMYWESPDGTNTYPVRLRRYKEFRQLAVSLGCHMVDGLQMSADAYEDFALAGYYENRKAPEKAAEHYRRYLNEDPANEFARGRLASLTAAAGGRA